MPTVHRWEGHRAFFVTHDCREPAHVHVDRGDATAKIWLEPVSVARWFGYSAVEVRRIVKVVEERRGRFLEIWDEHCARASDRGPRR